MKAVQYLLHQKNMYTASVYDQLCSHCKRLKITFIYSSSYLIICLRFLRVYSSFVRVLPSLHVV